MEEANFPSFELPGRGNISEGGKIMEMIRARLSPKDAAAYIGCSYGFLLELARMKKIPHFKIGVRFFFFQDSLDLWLRNQETKSTYSVTN
jgi:excisionase family DNA binding protein